MIWSYEKAVAFLCKEGVPEREIRDGSIPEQSLEFIVQHLSRPYHQVVLHVGNFVGISLAYLLATIPSVTVISVDPNIPHRKVTNPQLLTMKLLARFGLSERHLMVCGFSLEGKGRPMNVLRSLTDCGVVVDHALVDGDHDPEYLGREVGLIRELMIPNGLLVLDDVDEHWPGVADVFTGLDGEMFEAMGRDGRVGILRRR